MSFVHATSKQPIYSFGTALPTAYNEEFRPFTGTAELPIAHPAPVAGLWGDRADKTSDDSAAELSELGE